MYINHILIFVLGTSAVSIFHFMELVAAYTMRPGWKTVHVLMGNHGFHSEEIVWTGWTVEELLQVVLAPHVLDQLHLVALVHTEGERTVHNSSGATTLVVVSEVN